MQGIFINGRRPITKGAVKSAVAVEPTTVLVEATSLMGNEFGGPVDGITEGQKVYFVGPDPYTSRKFYGTITRDKNGRLVVK